MCGPISAFVTQLFNSITPKELKLKPITKFHKLFKFLDLMRIQDDAFSNQSRM